MTTTKSIRFLHVLIALTLVIAPFSSADAACSPVRGTIVTSFTTDGCTSPFGLCTAGTIDAGALTGTTYFAATSIQTEGVVTFFCGVFTVTNATGSATFDTCGTLNGKNGRFEETFTLTSATGSFAGATGRLVSTGSSTGTGFEGVFEGVLCSE